MVALFVLAVVLVTGGAGARARGIPHTHLARPMLHLVRSYEIPPGAPDAAGMRDRAWTYDAAVTACADAATGRVGAARALLDQLAALQRPDGAFDFSYDLVTRAGAPPLRSGAVAWVGLAALAYRGATGDHRYDRMLVAIARWLLERRVTDAGSPADGLLRGGPDVSWVSTEHNLEARAVLAALARASSGPWAHRLRAATAAIDAGIERALVMRDTAGVVIALRQGAGDDARPLDAQALGALWLAGQGRRADALRVLAGADATMLVTRPGAGLLGYRPYADAWGPDVLWTEGTLQMRLAKSALGLDTAALDTAIDRFDRAPGQPLPQADRTVLGNPAGDYRTWPAAAPGAWRLLSHSAFALLGR
jgi:hypothetical protein